MKLIVPFVLFMAVGFVLAGGCIAMTNKTRVNITTSATFAPFSNTSDPRLSTTINATANSTPKLEGSLRVSIGGISYPANLSVFLDNKTVGTVKPTSPLYLMVSEGNHTVMICMNSVCEQEEVTTRFGRYVTVDFSELLLRDMKFPDPAARPTARILGYYKNGDVVSVDVEFINPSTEDHLISVVVRCGYSYIDDRTGIRNGDSARGMVMQNVKAGQRKTESLNLHFASGQSYSYDSPLVEELKIK